MNNNYLCESVVRLTLCWLSKSSDASWSLNSCLSSPTSSLVTSICCANFHPGLFLCLDFLSNPQAWVVARPQHFGWWLFSACNTFDCHRYKQRLKILHYIIIKLRVLPSLHYSDSLLNVGTMTLSIWSQWLIIVINYSNGTNNENQMLTVTLARNTMTLLHMRTIVTNTPPTVHTLSPTPIHDLGSAQDQVSHLG